MWVRLAVRGGLDPWGHYRLADLITAARAKRQEEFQRDLQLAKLVTAVFMGDHKTIKRMIPED